MAAIGKHPTGVLPCLSPISASRVIFVKARESRFLCRLTPRMAPGPCPADPHETNAASVPVPARRPCVPRRLMRRARPAPRASRSCHRAPSPWLGARFLRLGSCVRRPFCRHPCRVAKALSAHPPTSWSHPTQQRNLPTTDGLRRRARRLRPPLPLSRRSVWRALCRSPGRPSRCAARRPNASCWANAGNVRRLCRCSWQY